MTLQNARKILRASNTSGALSASVLAEAQALVDHSPAGRGATFVVASSSIIGTTRYLQADYQCDGVADEEQIQQAYNALPSTGGQVLLSEGEFSVALTINPVSKSSLRGQGRGITVLKAATNLNNRVIFSNGKSDVGFFDLTIDGNLANQASGERRGILIFNGSRAMVDNIEARNCAYDGIVIQLMSRMQVINSLVYDCASVLNHGIAVMNSNHVILSGNIIYDCGTDGVTGMGIQVNSVATPSDHVTISNNIIFNCGLEGINVTGSTYMTVTGNIINDVFDAGITIYNTGAKYANVSDNICEFCGLDGILIETCNNMTVNSNICVNNGQRLAFVRSGIRLGTANNTICEGNLLTDDQGSKTQSWGISEDGASNNNIFTYNNVSGNLLGGISKVGAADIIQGNIGHKTENSGTATILSGTTSIVVTHGLAITPTNISLAQKEQATSEPGSLSWDTPTSTQFTIRCRNNPGASNLDVGWQAS